MAQSVYFNGETLTIPGAYSAVDTSLMTTKNSNDSAKIIALIGECAGGEPGALQYFTEPSAAKKTLKSGDLLKASEKAWNPVSGTKTDLSVGGANTIVCIRSNKATKSELAIKSGSKTQLKFVSKDWGANTNYQIKISDGTLSKTKKLTVYDQINEVYENYDNIGNAFTINYIGDEKYAELSIYVDDNKSMYLETKIGADKASAQKDISVQLTSTAFKNVKELINHLKSYENYVVTSSADYNSQYPNLKLKVTDLDMVDGAEIKFTSADSAYRVTTVYADLSYKLSSFSSLVELESYDSTCGEVQNMEYTVLTGGSEGSSPSSWVDYFDALSNIDVSYIVPLTSDVSIHAELASHIEKLSGNLGRERRGIVGGGIAETVKETASRANTLMSSRIQVVHGGLWDYNSDNELELYPPYILAAQHAGRVAFLDDGESATHDVYRMAAPEYKLTRDEITTLLNNGCLAFEFVLSRNSTSSSYVRLVQDLTTNITGTNSVETERATGALADSINKEIRESLDSLLTGKRTSASDLTSAKNAVISILSQRKSKGHIIAYKDVYLTKTGTVTEVDYSVAPAEPNNFTLITAHYYSATLTESSSSES